jgi:hypothetical protein
MHLFLNCDQAVQCWKEANSWHKLEHHQRQSGSFSTIIFSILTSLDEVSCAHFVVVVLWNIWRVQNEYLWEHKQVIPTTICFEMDIIRDYNWCCNSLGATHTPIPMAVWEKSEEN